MKMLSAASIRKIEEWLRKSSSEQSPAIILGSSVNALSFARSLGRRGIPILMLDSQRLIGSFTRFGEFIQLSLAEERPEEWIETLEFIGSHLDTKAVLFSTTDVHCLLVSEHRDRFRQSFRFIIPEVQAVEEIIDKRLQYSIAQMAGIPIPKTCFPESVEEARSFSSELLYPCLLKPYRSHAGRKELSNKKICLVDSPTELISTYERLAANHLPFMIQEIIPGEDSRLYGYLAFWDGDRRERAWMTKQKLRQNPPLYGDGSLQISVEALEVAELSRHLLRSFNYCGFVGVEFKYDTRDRTYRLIEINPRTVSGNQLAIDAGIDFPWIAYQYLTDSTYENAPVNLFRSGVKCVNEEWDLQAYLVLRKSGSLNLWKWLRSLRGAKTAIGAWDDPLPLLAGIWRLLKRCWQYLRERRSE